MEKRQERQGIRLLVPAKVNLALCVGERRPDGFHDVATIMQAVSLFDELTIHTGPPVEPAGYRDDTLGLAMRVFAPPDAGAGEVPAGPENIVWRAAVSCLAAAGRPDRSHPGLSLILKKNIPAGAGLGGGSADAAAALLGLNRLLALSLTPADLTELACSLGSDVPFFLAGGTALGRGRGEIVSRLRGAQGWLVLANPRRAVATRAVYEELDFRRGTCGATGQKAAGESATGASGKDEAWAVVAEDMARYLAGVPPSTAPRLAALPGLGHNDLLDPALLVRPELVSLSRTMCSAGLRPCLSGSGGTLYAAFSDCAAVSDQASARAAAKHLADMGYWARAVRAVGYGVRVVEESPGETRSN
jgi:4-diphosphocytidyl-2-C-methyl-D-erythritol kinase